MPDDSKKKLYEVITNEGLYTKSYDEFNQQYSTPESINKLYGVVKERGLYTKSYDEFNQKYFSGTTQPTVEQKKNQQISSETKTVQTVQETKPITTGQNSTTTKPDDYNFNSLFGSFIGGVIENAVNEKTYWQPTANKQQGFGAINPMNYIEITKLQFEAEKQAKTTVKQPINTQNNTEVNKGYGKRADGTEKGVGYFGELKRPDGTISTELSIGVEYDGKETQIPLLVPTLTRNEVDWLLGGNEPTKDIIDKADAHARQRMKDGKSPFAEVGEQVNITDLQYEAKPIKSVFSEITPDDIRVLTKQPNPYKEGTANFNTYNEKVTLSNAQEKRIENFTQQTGLKIEDYFGFEKMMKAALIERKDGFKTDQEYIDFENKIFNEYKEAKKISLSNDAESSKTLLKFLAAGFDPLLSSIAYLSSTDEELSHTKEKIGQRADYIMSSMLTNSLIGKTSLGIASLFQTLSNDKTWQENYSSSIGQHRENMSKYKDMSGIQEIAEMAINLGVDYGSFKGMHLISEAIVKPIWSIGANVLKGMGVAPRIANIAGLNAASNIAKGALTTGLTLGQYNIHTSVAEKLVEKPIQDFVEQDYGEVLKSGADGFASGLLVGTFAGMSNVVLQKLNSTILSRGYKLNLETGKMDIVSNKYVPTKLINLGWMAGSSVIEGGFFTVANEYLENGNLDGLTAKRFFSDGLKFAIAIKAQGAGEMIKQIKNSGFTISNDFKEPFSDKFNTEYSNYELKLLGVADKNELIEKSKDNEWLQNTINKNDLPSITGLKLLYSSKGMMFNKTFDIDRSVYENDNGEYLVKSYDKNGSLIDVKVCENEAEARDLEFIARDFNIRNGLFKKIAKLNSESVDKINAEYEGNKEDLIKINEALRKSPSDLSSGERILLTKLTDKIDSVFLEQVVKSEKNNKVEEKNTNEQEKIKQDEKENFQTETDKTVEGVKTVETDKGREYSPETKEEETRSTEPPKVGERVEVNPIGETDISNNAKSDFKIPQEFNKDVNIIENKLLNDIDESNEIILSARKRIGGNKKKIIKIQEENIRLANDKLKLLRENPLEFFKREVDEYNEWFDGIPDANKQEYRWIKENADYYANIVDGIEKANTNKPVDVVSGEVNIAIKGQEPIEAKPIEETSGKEVKASRDVQTPEKEEVKTITPEINLQNGKKDVIFVENNKIKNGKTTGIYEGATGSIPEVQSRTQSHSEGMFSKQNRVDNIEATEQEWRRGDGNNGKREILRGPEQPIINTLLTGHKSPFDIFDIKYRGTGIGNQGGGIFFTTDSDFALDIAKKSATGGYEFNKHEATGTPYISEVFIKNPNMVWGTMPIPHKIKEQIGEINGISPNNYKEYIHFYDDLLTTFLKDKTNFTDYSLAQNKTSDILREKGITGHVIDKGEIIIYSEKDIVKIKQTKIVLSGEKIEASRDVQAPEKEIVAEKESKGELAMKADGGGSEIRLNLMSEIRKGANEVKKNINSLIRDVRTKINDAKESGKLSEMEHSAILTGLEKATKGNNFETKKQALLDYVEKKLVGAEMRQDISNAKSNKGKINKIINRKKLPFGNSTAEVRNAINEIEINDLTSEQLKEYNSILSDAVKLGNKQTPQSIDDLLKKVESLNASIMDSKVTDSKVTDYKSFIDFLNTIKTSDFNDINDFKSTIRKYRNGQKMASKLFNDGIITESEYNMITEQMSNDYENLKVGLSEKQSEMKDEFINAGNEKLKEVTKIMSGKNNNIIPETEKGMVNDIIVKMQNPEVAKNLKLQDAEMYEYVMDNLTNGFINGVTHDFYRKVIDSYYNIDVPKNIEPLSNSKKFRNMAKVIDNNLAKWNGLLQSLNAYRISEFFGVLNNKFYNSIFREHIQDMVKSERFKQDILKPVLDASKKVLKESGIINKRKNFNDTMIKLAIIRTEKMWQNNLQKDLDGKTYEPNDATKPEHLKNYWDAVKSKNLKVADVKNSKNYEHTLRIWDKLKSDASLWKDGKKEVKEFDYQSAIDKLSKNEKELMNEIDKLSEKIKPYVESAALKHGKEFKDINDYDFQHFVIEHLRGKNLEPDFAGDLLREAQSTPTSQAKSTISRTMQPMAIRTDLINILNTHVSDVSQDFFVREKLLAKLRAINKADVGSKNFNKALQNTIIARATRSLDREIVKDPETQEVLNSTFGLISKALLGRITRMPQEIISNIDRNVFAQGFKSGVKAIFKNKIDDVYYDMLDEMIESNKSYSSLAEHINKSKTLGGKFIESIIVFADKRTVPPIFESEFNKSFKKQTGKEFDLEKYKTDFDYRLKNNDAIEMAKSDAIVRSQELFNTKTLLDNATHIMWFGRSFDKNNIVGKTGYFLQSFSHNEAKQMMKSAKRMFSGDKKEFARGLRDSLAIVTSNYIYMQLGFLISSMTKNIWSKLTDDEDGNMAESFNDGLNEYYDNYLNSDKIAKSTLASLIALSSGKYNYAVAGLTGLLMGVINDSKNIKKETKDDIEDYGKGMYIRPISFKSSRIYEVGRFHPIFNELINLGDLIFVQTPDIANDIYKGDVDAIELGYVFNSIIRLTYVNPISNQIQNDLKRANYNNEKLKKEKEKKDKKSGNKW